MKLDPGLSQNNVMQISTTDRLSSPIYALEIWYLIDMLPKCISSGRPLWPLLRGKFLPISQFIF